MSERRENDYYPTPAWCVHRLLDRYPISGKLYEPCCGDGAIIRAHTARSERSGGAAAWWIASDIDQKMVQRVERLPEVRSWLIADALRVNVRREEVDAIITNPPYSLAFEFARWAVEGGVPIVAMLLRMAFIASAKRAPWLQEHMPSMYVLPNRPSFTGGGTDTFDYAWFVWDNGPARIEVLDATTIEERNAPEAQGRLWG